MINFEVIENDTNQDTTNRLRVIKPYAEIVNTYSRDVILNKINEFGRICYKSNTPDSVEQKENFIRSLINNGHHSVLEHISITVRFVVDRGISHELVRHRIASFSQESTRYCNYSKGRFGNSLTVIYPKGIANTKEHNKDVVPDEIDNIWYKAMESARDAYFDLLDKGVTPEFARSVLPTSVKTEVIMTANLREWLHFFNLRLKGTTGKPHPQMVEVTRDLIKQFQEAVPVVFDDIQE